MMDVPIHNRIVQALTEKLHAIALELQAAHGNTTHQEKLHAFDLITDWDVRVEQDIRQLLTELDPETPIVGEETGGDTTVDKYWLVDPIDGTIHFVRGNPFCTAMIALIVDKRPAVSIIYNYSTKECFSAIKGQGAFVNGQPIHTSQRVAGKAVVLVEMQVRKPENLAAYQRLGEKNKLMNMICAGYEFSLVASGKAEARIARDPLGQPYDFAPGVLLVQEAGGVVRNFDGEEYTVDDREFIAAGSSEVYDSLCETIGSVNKNGATS